MRRLVRAVLVALFVLVALPQAKATPVAGRTGARPYIVLLRDSVSRPRAVAAEHARRYGVRPSRIYRFAIEGYAATIPEGVASRLRADPRVASVMPDRPIHAVVQRKPTGIRRIAAPLSSTRSGNGSGVVDADVAVIDTGVDLDHPDLNVVGGVNCSTGVGLDDQSGHGSHVAGTIAARDNAIGVVGVAPGARLWSVRVLDRTGSGTFSTVLCGIDFVDAHAPANGGPIGVANMSIGGPGADDGACGAVDGDAIHAAICAGVADGVTFVAAAGNSGSGFAGQIPAAYDEVLTVTAVADFDGKPGGAGAPTCRSDVDDTAANFSNFAAVGSGEETHVIAAPGVCIYSTWKDGAYRKISGTSMATPHVTGAVALCTVSGACAGLSPPEIIAKLRSDAAARPVSYGFVGDPSQPIAGPDGSTRYYGHLLYVGGY